MTHKNQNVGKLFNLTKHRYILLKSLNHNNPNITINNMESKTTVLVLKESIGRVNVLYNKKIYNMSKHYLHSPIKGVSSNDSLSFKDEYANLIEYYFKLVTKNVDNIPKEFVEFGSKLKDLEEILTAEE